MKHFRHCVSRWHVKHQIGTVTLRPARLLAERLAVPQWYEIQKKNEFKFLAY
jgi:hypothetical protein